MTTWNPTNKGNIITLTDGNLTAEGFNTSNSVISSDTKTKGKWYCEITDVSDNNLMFGIIKTGLSMTTVIHSSADGYFYYRTGNKRNNAVNTLYGTAFTSGDVIGILIDMDNGDLTFYKNGANYGIAFSGINILGEIGVVATGATGSGTATATANFGATPFKYPPLVSELPKGVYSYDGSQKLSPSERSFILHNGQYKTYKDKKWVNVSSTTPTQSQFETLGMDNLTVVLKRQTTTMAPMPMTNKSTILLGESGAVFGINIGLKKLFDLQKIYIEEVK